MMIDETIKNFQSQKNLVKTKEEEAIVDNILGLLQNNKKRLHKDNSFAE